MPPHAQVSPPATDAAHCAQERAARLDRLRSAARAMAQRGAAGCAPQQPTHKSACKMTVECPYRPRLLPVRPHARGRGLGSDSQYQFELENQAGQALTLAPAAREALVTGLALHDRAQRSLQQVAQCANTHA
jgi:hypothetical protein